MNKLRLFLRRIFVENIGIKIVSLLASLVLFYFVREGKQERKNLVLPIELQIPKGVVQTNEIARQVEIAIVGPKAVVDSLTASKLGVVQIDLTPFGIGASTLFLQREMFSGIPSNVSMSSISPSYIAVRLEKEESRLVPITPILKGRVAHGYRIDRYTLSDREMTLIGPTSLVERTDFLETEPIDIAEVTQTVTRRVPIRLPAPSMRISQTDPVAVTVHIVEEIIEQQLEVPVVAASIEGAVIDPKSIEITVRGPLRLVEKLVQGDVYAEPQFDKPPRLGSTHSVGLRLFGLPREVVRIGDLPKVKVHIERVAKPKAAPDAGNGATAP
ncbi:MAG: YbbR-like domain-containing protein [Deltaproteobacteria bacterium]|nr:YbbR-like domain-containing protein [Deltaproteobacteria bacterium]